MSENVFTGKLVTGEQLMDSLFTEQAKPSQRWLRTQIKNGVIIPVRIGGLVFFDEAAVRRALVGNGTGK